MIAILGAVVFSMATVMYILLAFGLPLGEFAMGGKYKVMPKNLRIACAVSVVVQLFAIMIILQTGGIIPMMFSYKVTRFICFFFAFYLSVNCVMNALSKSRKEKLFVTPLSVIAAVCFWITAINA